MTISYTHTISSDWLYQLKWLNIQLNVYNAGSLPFSQTLSSPFIFSFRVKLPWIFFSSASMVRPPMSASRWVRFTMPMPNTMSVTCCGSELTRLRLLPPGGLLGVLESCCSFSKMTLQSGSEGRRPFSAKSQHGHQLETLWCNLMRKTVVCHDRLIPCELWGQSSRKRYYKDKMLSNGRQKGKI